MPVYSVLAVNFVIKLIEIIWFICAAALIFIILIQKGKGGGLSGIFGSSMAGSLLGADTKKPMTWFTIGLVSVFLILAVLLAKYDRPGAAREEPITPASVPAATTSPAGTTEPLTEPDVTEEADDLAGTILNADANSQ